MPCSTGHTGTDKRDTGRCRQAIAGLPPACAPWTRRHGGPRWHGGSRWRGGPRWRGGRAGPCKKNGQTKAAETAWPPCPAVVGSGSTSGFGKELTRNRIRVLVEVRVRRGRRRFPGFPASPPLPSTLVVANRRPGQADPVCCPTSGGASRDLVPADVSVSPSTSSFGGLYGAANGAGPSQSSTPAWKGRNGACARALPWRPSTSELVFLSKNIQARRARGSKSAGTDISRSTDAGRPYLVCLSACPAPWWGMPFFCLGESSPSRLPQPITQQSWDMKGTFGQFRPVRGTQEGQKQQVLAGSWTPARTLGKLILVEAGRVELPSENDPRKASTGLERL